MGNEDTLQRVSYIAEYIARADELVKRVGNDPKIRAILDENIDKAYRELKYLHPDPEGVIEETWDEIANEEGGIVLPLEDHTTDHDKFIQSKSISEQKEKPDVATKTKGDSIDEMVLSLMEGATLTSKTPDAKSRAIIYKGKDKTGTIHYGDKDEEIKKLMNSKVKL